MVSFPSYALVLSAYKASDYLQSLLQRGAIVPRSDPDLDAIYASHAPSNALHNATKSDGKDEGREVLLRRDAVPQILQLYGLPESAGSDIYRAVEQADARLRKGIYK